MNIEDFFVLAYAPSANLQLDLDASPDATVENLCNTIESIRKFSDLGLEEFVMAFRKEEANDKTASNATALRLLQVYLERIKRGIEKVTCQTSEVLSSGYPSHSAYIGELCDLAQTEGLTPNSNKLKKLFQCGPDAKWTFDISKSKVAFRTSVSIVESHDGNTDSIKTHRAIKSEDVPRRSVRQQTGYAKFSFRDILEKEIEEWVSSEDDTESPPTTIISPPPKFNEEEAVSEPQCTLFQVLCCGDTEATHSEALLEPPLVRRQSSVSLGSVQEIQDRDADKNWSEKKRHEIRFKRIRNRIPTGHASLMKADSEELLHELESEGSEEFYATERGDEASQGVVVGSIASESESSRMVNFATD